MIEKELIVTSKLGIHARPASMIVKVATNYVATIQLRKDALSADAKSIMEVMMLAAAYNTSITVRAKGPDEEDALRAIEELFKQKFNEE